MTRDKEELAARLMGTIEAMPDDMVREILARMGTRGPSRPRSDAEVIKVTDGVIRHMARLVEELVRESAGPIPAAQMGLIDLVVDRILERDQGGIEPGDEIDERSHGVVMQSVTALMTVAALMDRADTEAGEFMARMMGGRDHG